MHSSLSLIYVFLAVLTPVLAIPVQHLIPHVGPIHRGDVLAAKPSKFVPAEGTGTAHPVIVHDGPDHEGNVMVIQASHNLPADHKVQANEYVGPHQIPFTSKHGRDTLLDVGALKRVHQSDLHVNTLGGPQRIESDHMNRLVAAVARKGTVQTEQKATAVGSAGAKQRMFSGINKHLARPGSSKSSQKAAHRRKASEEITGRKKISPSPRHKTAGTPPHGKGSKRQRSSSGSKSPSGRPGRRGRSPSRTLGKAAQHRAKSSSPLAGPSKSRNSRSPSRKRQRQSSRSPSAGPSSRIGHPRSPRPKSPAPGPSKGRGRSPARKGGRR